MSRTQNFATRKENVKLCHNKNNNNNNTMISLSTTKTTERLDLSGSINVSIDEITKKFNFLLKTATKPKEIRKNAEENAENAENVEENIQNVDENIQNVDENIQNDVQDGGIPPQLISRGPSRSDRPKTKCQPYLKPSNSPFSSSDSSLGSPPLATSADYNCSYGGLLTVFPNKVSDEENGLSISPNRKQYMHKNGGEVQILWTSLPNSQYTRSPTSDYSSYESDATTDSWCPAYVSEDSNGDELSSVYDLIENHSAKGSEEVDRKVYDEEIDRILQDLDSQESDEVRIPVGVVESAKSAPVASNVVFASGIGPVVLVDGSNRYVLAEPSVDRGLAAAYAKFKPIKMKGEAVVNGVNSRVSALNVPEFDPDAIRKSILSTYTEKDKRDRQCWASKLQDDELMLGDEEGDRPLHIAVTNRQQLEAVCLINVMANLDAKNLDVRNKYGQTALFIAACSKQHELVEYLLAKGANPNEPCLNNGETVLHYVCQFGKHLLPVVDILMRSPDTKVDAFDNLGRTPLITSIEGHGRHKKIDDNRGEIIDSLPAVRYLLHHGASVACREKRSGKTAFHVAIENKCFSILEVLCYETRATSAAVNVANYSGQTPLHYSAVLNNVTEMEQIKFVKLLLNAGACSKVSNRENKTSADLVDKGRDEVKKLLSHRQRRVK